MELGQENIVIFDIIKNTKQSQLVKKTKNNIANALSENLICEVVPYVGKNMRLSPHQEKNNIEEVKKIMEYEKLIKDSVNSINTSYLNIAYALFAIYSKNLSFCYQFKMADYKGVERDNYSFKSNNDLQFNAYVRESFGLSKTTASNLLGIARNFLKVDPDNEFNRLPELTEQCKNYSFSQLCELLPFFIENNVLVGPSKIFKFLSSDLTILQMREKKKNFIYSEGNFIEKMQSSPSNYALPTIDEIEEAEDIIDEIIESNDIPLDDCNNFVSDDNRIFKFKNDIEREKFIRNYLSWPICGKNNFLDLVYRILFFSNGDKLIAMEYPQELVKYHWQYKDKYISFLDTNVAQLVDYIRTNKLRASYINIFDI